jgi:hypothetical protein
VSINKYIIEDTIKLWLRVSHTFRNVIPRINVSRSTCFNTFGLQAARAVGIACIKTILVDCFHQGLLVRLGELLFQLLFNHAHSLRVKLM